MTLLSAVSAAAAAAAAVAAAAAAAVVAAVADWRCGCSPPLFVARLEPHCNARDFASFEDFAHPYLLWSSFRFEPRLQILGVR